MMHLVFTNTCYIIFLQPAKPFMSLNRNLRRKKSGKPRSAASMMPERCHQERICLEINIVNSHLRATIKNGEYRRPPDIQAQRPSRRFIRNEYCKTLKTDFDKGIKTQTDTSQKQEKMLKTSQTWYAPGMCSYGLLCWTPQSGHMSSTSRTSKCGP